MGQLPTFWYRTEYFWIGAPLFVDTLDDRLTTDDRLSSLGYEART